MTDFLFLEELTKLNDRVTKPRLIHENGAGAYGFFRPYMNMKDFTRAEFLSESDRETRVFVRFSKALGGHDSPETTRDLRGFCVKFFTEEGTYDLICQHLPVFYIKDVKKILKLFRCIMPPKDRKYADSNKIWEFLSENPESIHLILRLFSPEGYVSDYVSMDAYSVNTYKWINYKNEITYIRYRWKAKKRKPILTSGEAEFLAGFSPHCATEALRDAIDNGDFPAYDLQVQKMTENEKKEEDFAIFDKTLVWPESRYPFTSIGKLTLTENPADYTGEVSKSFFSVGNLIRGIELPEEDDFLQYMNFAHNQSARERGVK